jgi:predicted metalloprotease with PDZ domain
MRNTILLLLGAVLLWSCNEHDFLPNDRATTPFSSFTVSVDTVNKFYLVDMKCVPAGDTLSLMLPEWMPGAYNIYNFSKNVVSFSASDNKGNALSYYKPQVYNWKIPCKDVDTVCVSYKIFSNVQTKIYQEAGRINKNMALMLPASVFFYQEGEKDKPVHVHFNVPADWTNMTTPLEDEGNFTFTAKDVDELYDSPFFVGKQERIFFEQSGHKYEIAYWGGLGIQRDSVLAHIDIFKNAASAVEKMMGYIPYNRYCFMLLYGSEDCLEHRACQTDYRGSNVFQAGRTSNDIFRFSTDIYHEFFHVWNSKIIKPIELGPFDYQHTVPCNMLWFIEGVTEYYAEKMLLKNGEMSVDFYKDYASTGIERIQTRSAYKVMSLEQASIDTWMFVNDGTEEYDYDTIFPNYYIKGCIVGFFMDVFMVNATGGKKSLDDFMHTLDRFCTSNNRGFTKAEFWKIYKEMCGCDISQLLKYVETTEELDYDKMLQPVGWKVNKSTWEIEDVDNPTATQLKYRSIVAN